MKQGFTHLLIGWILLLNTAKVEGQTNAPAYKAGKLYVIMNAQLPATGVPLLDRSKDINQLTSAQFPDLYQLSQRFGFTQLKKAFHTRSKELDRTYVVEFTRDQQADDLIEALQQVSYVEYVEKVPTIKKSYLPNDWTGFDDLYHLEIINAQDAWDVSRGSEDVVIAIVDDAILITHEDLRDNIWVNPDEIPGNGVDDDDNGYIDDVNGFDVTNDRPNPNPPRDEFSHGTFVAGCAAASTDNGVGIPAIGFNCKIMAVRASSNTFNESITDGYEGVDYAISAGATIINMSWGGGGFSRVQQNLMNAAHNRGIILVAASGNDNSDQIQYPAGYEHVISVGATNRDDRRAGFSNFGTVDIMAPGDNVLSTVTGGASGSYGENDGTSFASPIIAGVLGLMKSVNPCLSPEEAERILDQTAVNIDEENPDFTGRLGSGRVDAGAAVLAASQAEGSGTPPPPVANFTFDNASECTNRIPFNFVSEPGTGSCAFSIDYRWRITNGNGFELTSNERDPIVEFPNSGEYTVSLRVNNSGGADEMSETVTIEVNPDAFIDAGDSRIVCQGDSVAINASTTATIESLRWEPALGLSDPNTLTPTFRALRAGGNYTLTINGADGCELVDSVQIDVFRNPFVQTIPGNDTVLILGDTLQLGVQEGSGAFAFEWSPAAGLSDTSIANPLAFPDTMTTYRVVGIGGGGCTDEAEITIEVALDGGLSNKPFFSRLGTIFPPYPHPAQHGQNLTADFNQLHPLTLTLIDLHGRLIQTLYEGVPTNGTFSHYWVPGNRVTPGVYFLHWQYGATRHIQRIQVN